MKSHNKPGVNILSVDLGTSSVRACLVDGELKIRHQSTRSLHLDTDTTGKAEMDAEQVIAKTLACMRESLQWGEENLLPVDAISFSSASASLVCLDDAFNPIRPALTYADLRASEESQWVIKTYGRSAFTHTGAPMHASYWLPKLLWLRSQGLPLEGNLFFCTIKGLLIHRLTGQFLMDASNAGAAGMMDARTLDWDELSTGIAGIKASQFPKILPSTTVLEMRPDHIESLGDQAHSPKIVLGAMDGVLASLGVGAYQPGQAATSLGSSGACRIASPRPLINQGDLRIWSYPLTENLWVSGGAMNNGGLVTRWLAENFSESRQADDDAYREMLNAAGRISPGSDGLIFLPYLFGERAPIYDEQARGVYFGLHNRHQRGHFARAGLEGILFALYTIYEILAASQEKVNEIRAAGGYLQSDLMLQMQADIFGEPILIPKEQEGSIIGAAALAQKALGQINDFVELSERFSIQGKVMPDPAAHRIYREKFQRFKALYHQLAPLF